MLWGEKAEGLDCVCAHVCVLVCMSVEQVNLASKHPVERDAYCCSRGAVLVVHLSTKALALIVKREREGVHYIKQARHFPKGVYLASTPNKLYQFLICCYWQLGLGKVSSF